MGISRAAPPPADFVPGQIVAGLSTDAGDFSAPLCHCEGQAYAQHRLLRSNPRVCIVEIASGDDCSGLPMWEVEGLATKTGGVAVISVPAGQETAWAAHLAGMPGIRWAEPNYLLRALADPAEPSDPLWPEQWWQHTIGTAAAWDITWGDPDIVIAVADTGIDLGHPDRPTLWLNPAETPDNGLDDDGNGKIDDVQGWHWYYNRFGQSREDNDIQVPTEVDPLPNPSAFHGMHVAGIIGAAVDNEIGVAGVVRGPQIMTLRVLNENALGSIVQVSEAIRYAADNGAQIINLSLGAPVASNTLQEAVAYAVGQGVHVIAAAGNGNGPLYYPAAYPEVVAVGGTTPEDDRYHRSNYGDELDLVAPATGILSTWASSLHGGYFDLSGTSMAAPQVAGTLALLHSLRPHETPAQLESRLYDTALDLGAEGRDVLYGWGRLRVDEAVLAAAEGLILSGQLPSSTLPGETAVVVAEIRDEEDAPAGSGLPIRFSIPVEPESDQMALTKDGRAELSITIPADWPDASLPMRATWHDQEIMFDIPITLPQTPTPAPPQPFFLPLMLR